MNTKDIAKRLGITIPTVYSRRKKLIRSGLMKIAGLVDMQKVEDIIIALVGISVEKDDTVDHIVKELAKLKQVTWVAVVTGRYDIIAEVLLTKGVRSLYQFTTKALPSLGSVKTSESFVIMKAEKKWALLPPELEGWSADE